MQKKISVSEVLNAAFLRFKEHWLILSALTLGVVVVIYAAFFAVIFSTDLPIDAIQNIESAFSLDAMYSLPIAFIVLYGVISVLSCLLSLFFYRAALYVVDNNEFNLSEIFSSALKSIWPFLGVFLCISIVSSIVQFTLGMVGGSLVAVLLIYPYIRLSLAHFYVLDGVSVIDSFKQSWRTTEGNALTLFLCAVVCCFICVVAMFCCLLPVFPAASFLLLAFATAYRMLNPKQGDTESTALVLDEDITDVDVIR